MHGRLHLRVRARELRVEAHIDSRVEIDRAWFIAHQAVEVGAAQVGAGRWWLECALREVVRGEVERLEGEHGRRRSRAPIDGGGDQDTGALGRCRQARRWVGRRWWCGCVSVVMWSGPLAVVQKVFARLRKTLQRCNSGRVDFCLPQTDVVLGSGRGGPS